MRVRLLRIIFQALPALAILVLIATPADAAEIGLVECRSAKVLGSPWTAGEAQDVLVMEGSVVPPERRSTISEIVTADMGDGTVYRYEVANDGTCKALAHAYDRPGVYTMTIKSESAGVPRPGGGPIVVEVAPSNGSPVAFGSENRDVSTTEREVENEVNNIDEPPGQRTDGPLLPPLLGSVLGGLIGGLAVAGVAHAYSGPLSGGGYTDAEQRAENSRNAASFWALASGALLGVVVYSFLATGAGTLLGMTGAFVLGGMLGWLVNSVSSWIGSR